MRRGSVRGLRQQSGIVGIGPAPVMCTVARDRTRRSPVPGSGTVASRTWIAAQYPDLDKLANNRPQALDPALLIAGRREGRRPDG